MEHLKILQKYDKNNLDINNYTWANTPDRTDYSLNQSIARFDSRELTYAISSMIETGLIKDNFTVLDLFGGTGAMIYRIKESFPNCTPICIDFKYHNSWKEINDIYPDINFFQIDYFELEKESASLNLDLLMTFNTFRGWDNSVGPFVNQKYSKQQFCNWIQKNSNYFITDRGNVEDYFEMLPFDSPFNQLKVAYSK